MGAEVGFLDWFTIHGAVYVLVTVYKIFLEVVSVVGTVVVAGGAGYLYFNPANKFLRASPMIADWAKMIKQKINKIVLLMFFVLILIKFVKFQI